MIKVRVCAICCPHVRESRLGPIDSLHHFYVLIVNSHLLSIHALHVHTSLLCGTIVLMLARYFLRLLVHLRTRLNPQVRLVVWHFVRRANKLQVQIQLRLDKHLF